jgi:hypothetical protein
MFDQASPYYPPELAIACQAWKSVSQRARSDKQPKSQIREWLEKHYRDHLSNDAKERIATVCNWNKAGGNLKGPAN